MGPPTHRPTLFLSLYKNRAQFFISDSDLCVFLLLRMLWVAGLETEPVALDMLGNCFASEPQTQPVEDFALGVQM